MNRSSNEGHMTKMILAQNKQRFYLKRPITFCMFGYMRRHRLKLPPENSQLLPLLFGNKGHSWTVLLDPKLHISGVLYLTGDSLLRGWWTHGDHQKIYLLT